MVAGRGVQHWVFVIWRSGPDFGAIPLGENHLLARNGNEHSGTGCVGIARALTHSHGLMVDAEDG